jgi:hypothetical protein
VQAETLHLPVGWRATLQDGQGRVLRSLRAPGDGANLTLDAAGAASARLALTRVEHRRQPPDEHTPPNTSIATAAGAVDAATVVIGTRLALGDAGTAVRLYDVRGRMLRLDRADAAGIWTWDGRDGRGRRLSRGVYWVQGRAGGVATRRRVVWAN